MTASTVLYDAPGPRALARNRVISVVASAAIAAVVWFVVTRLKAKGQLTVQKWEPFTTADLWRTYVLPGVQGTLTAAVLSIVLALSLGVVLGVGRLSTVSAVRWVSGAVVEFFRAVPVLIMMIFAFFLYAQYDVFPARQLALAGVVTGLTLYNGAVIAEIVKAGVNALPRGQSEAASALGVRPGQAVGLIPLPHGQSEAAPPLGLRPGQTMGLILLPQAITAMLPALISQLVVVLKDTAIGYHITFMEVVRHGALVGV